VTLPELHAALATQREALRRKITSEAVHAFARTVNGIGYHDVRVLAQEHIALDELVAQVHHYYEVVLKRDPKDAAALNNIGVFICDNGQPKLARPYFAKAARLASEDRNIHENLRIADILMHKPEARWHDYPDTLTPGAHTLVAYFDPHAM
jgi:Tfp pilus assembly protein PilF